MGCRTTRARFDPGDSAVCSGGEFALMSSILRLPNCISLTDLHAPEVNHGLNRIVWLSWRRRRSRTGCMASTRLRSRTSPGSSRSLYSSSLPSPWLRM